MSILRVCVNCCTTLPKTKSMDEPCEHCNKEGFVCLTEQELIEKKRANLLKNTTQTLVVENVVQPQQNISTVIQEQAQQVTPKKKDRFKKDSSPPRKKCTKSKEQATPNTALYTTFDDPSLAVWIKQRKGNISAIFKNLLIAKVKESSEIIDNRRSMFIQEASATLQRAISADLSISIEKKAKLDELAPSIANNWLISNLSKARMEALEEVGIPIDENTRKAWADKLSTKVKRQGGRFKRVEDWKKFYSITSDDSYKQFVTAYHTRICVSKKNPRFKQTQTAQITSIAAPAEPADISIDE